MEVRKVIETQNFKKRFPVPTIEKHDGEAPDDSLSFSTSSSPKLEIDPNRLPMVVELTFEGYQEFLCPKHFIRKVLKGEGGHQYNPQFIQEIKEAPPNAHCLECKHGV